VARREHILDAAERCFASSGFHATTIQDICKAANISAGALYLHFGSKEALIAGIVERDRQKLTNEVSALADANDLMQALSALGQHYFVNEPQFKRVLHVEIGAESTRNAEIGAAFNATDKYCTACFRELFERARDAGRIAPTMEIALIANVMNVIADGMFWRRAVDPTFDANAIMPAFNAILASLLNPVTVPTNTPLEAPLQVTT
jgi:TetR/AcrR family transcriptional regulator, repressor for uid operon